MTTLRAAENFDKEYLFSPALAPLIDGAKIFYISGYFLSHAADTALEFAKKVSAAGKVGVDDSNLLRISPNPTVSQILALNTAAPFICQYFNAQLSLLLPYCDFVIGNDTEAELWATTAGHANIKDALAIGKIIATLPKANASRPRVVVITRGSDSTVLVSSDEPDSAKIIPVHPLKDDEIVDTNGAGDAFAGGFLGGCVAGKSPYDAVLAGHKLAATSIQLVSLASGLLFPACLCQG